MVNITLLAQTSPVAEICPQRARVRVNTSPAVTPCSVYVASSRQALTLQPAESLPLGPRPPPQDRLSRLVPGTRSHSNSRRTANRLCGASASG